MSFVVSSVYAQSYQKINNGVNAHIGQMDVMISFYSPSIVRVLKSPEGIVYNKKSLSVIMEPGETDFSISERGNDVILKSDSLQVMLNLNSGKVSYSRFDGVRLLTEKDYGTQFTPVKFGEENTFQVRQAFLLDIDEPIYGLGQHQKGRMNQRNQKLVLRQENQVTSIPYIQSVKGYGVYWDNYSVTTFTDNVSETAFDSETGKCADYYFMYGRTADNVVKEMRKLTGQVQMNPLWTYGFWQSREKYESQKQLLEVVKKYRELQVPLDGIVQDWRYWGTADEDWNGLCFNNSEYPDPKQMIEDVHKMNAHIAVSIWPQFGPRTDIYKEFNSKKMLLPFTLWPGDVRAYDSFNPQARDIYWEHLNRNIYSLGVDAWWMDATEPEIFDDDPQKFNVETYIGMYRTVANAYPLATVGGVYEHNRRIAKEKRVYIFTRSAFAGQQRYGANSWSGDIKSTWEMLHNQISAGLNFSICGIPYWNADIGGFVACTYPDGVKDPRYRELYIRWNQFGAFTPMMRSHGTCTPREIYQFGDRGSWEFDAIEKYIRMRYLMLPYMYSTAWNVTSNGGSFMRALFMDFPNDKKVLDMNDQYMYGKSLLVAPVTRSMYVTDDKIEDFSKVKTEPVYLPRGTEWYDFWTGEKFNGGQTVNREVPIDIMPLYVRAGSILPLGPDVQYAEEKKWDALEIRIYSGADAEFTLYEDENDNYNYEKGFYSIITFKWDDAKQILTITDRNGEFPGMLKKRKFKIVLVNKKQGIGDQLSESINKIVPYNGKSVRIQL